MYYRLFLFFKFCSRGENYAPYHTYEVSLYFLSPQNNCGLRDFSLKTAAAREKTMTFFRWIAELVLFHSVLCRLDLSQVDLCLILRLFISPSRSEIEGNKGVQESLCAARWLFLPFVLLCLKNGKKWTLEWLGQNNVLLHNKCRLQCT